MYSNVNFNVFFKLIKVHLLLVSEFYTANEVVLRVILFSFIKQINLSVIMQ